jgi:hypothetical protein
MSVDDAVTAGVGRVPRMPSPQYQVKRWHYCSAAATLGGLPTRPLPPRAVKGTRYGTDNKDCQHDVFTNQLMLQK